MLFSLKGSIFGTGGDFVNGPYFPLWFKVASQAPMQNPRTSNFPFRILVLICMLLSSPFLSGPLSCPHCVSSVFLRSVTAILPLLFPRRGCEEMSCPQVVPVLQRLVFPMQLKPCGGCNINFYCISSLFYFYYV